MRTRAVVAPLVYLVRVVFIATLLVLSVWALSLGWKEMTTRSATIEFEEGTAVTYTMTWGWGMEQSFSIAGTGRSNSQFSGNIEIWKRPYNSGMAIYRSEDGRKYYFGLGYGWYVFDVASKNLKPSCTHDLPLTDLGRELILLGRDPAAIELKDPGRTSVYGYIEPDQVVSSPIEPTPSRYYVGIVYLGKLGLIRPLRDGFERGENVAFAPPGKVLEPRLALLCAG